MKISKAMTESMTNPIAPSERLLYPDLSSVSERLLNEKIQANKKFNKNINIIEDIRNYYETETNNYNKNLSRYKNYFNVAETREILLSSIATTATTTSVALTGIGLPYSIPTAGFLDAAALPILLAISNALTGLLATFFPKLTVALPTLLKKPFNPSASIVASDTVIDLFLLHLVQDPLNILVPFEVIAPLILLVPL